MSETEELWGNEKANTNVNADDEGFYAVDKSKIKTLEDVIALIDALDIKFTKAYHRFGEIEHLVTRLK